MGSTVSSWRAPWFETTIPATPRRRGDASSGSSTPFATSGTGSDEASSATSSQVIEPSSPGLFQFLHDHRHRPDEPCLRGAVAVAGDGLVDREHDRLEPELDGRIGELAREPAVGEEMQVEPARRIGRRRDDFLHRLRRPAGEDVDPAGGRDPAQVLGLAARMGERLCHAVGADANGWGRCLPSSVTEVATFETSTRIRWRNAMCRQAATFASSVISSAAPVAK